MKVGEEIRGVFGSQAVPFRKAQILRSQAPKRKAIYLQPNTETHSRNHCCCGKAMSIAHSQCVAAALGNQYNGLFTS
jgi:hypothetical protein